MIIRKAELRDLEETLVLGWEMHQESRYRSMDFNLEKVAELLEVAIKSDEYLFLVVEKNSRVVGGFIGYATAQWFSNDLAAGDFALFMAPEYRGSSAPYRLVKEFIAWAKGQGVRSENISLGITTGVHTDKTKALYEKLGFKMTGLVMNYGGGM